MNDYEAIDMLYEAPSEIQINGNMNTISKWLEAIDISTEALKKQLPIKPKYDKDTYMCSVCGEKFSYQKAYKYCSNCGCRMDNSAHTKVD